MNLPSLSLARTAGFVYLIVVLTGIVSLAYVPSQLIHPGDAAKTVASIQASQDLFRIGIAAGFVCYLAFLLLPLLLYRLLGHVSQTAGVLMVILAIVSVPISLFNIAHKLDVLSLLGGNDYLSALPAEQLQTAVMLSLERYNNGLLVAMLFWGLWLLPLGYLIFKSRALPRVLGVLLMAGCVGYLIAVFGDVLSASWGDFLLAKYVTLPASLGEIGTCLWLIVMGAKTSN